MFRPRNRAPRIVSVTNHWRCYPDAIRREVIVAFPDGLRSGYLEDDHPALVEFLAGVAA